MKILGHLLGFALLGLAIIAGLAFFIWALTPVATADAFTPGYWQSWCIVLLFGVAGVCMRSWSFKP